MMTLGKNLLLSAPVVATRWLTLLDASGRWEDVTNVHSFPDTTSIDLLGNVHSLGTATGSTCRRTIDRYVHNVSIGQLDLDIFPAVAGVVRHCHLTDCSNTSRPARLEVL